MHALMQRFFFLSCLVCDFAHRQRVASKSALSGEQPWHTTEIAVVPSLIMHLQEQRWHGHLAWNLMLPKECMESKFTQAELCMGKGYGNVGLHRHYWDLVRKVHFAPYTLRGLRRVGERNSSGRIAMKPPLIVVHHSFTWDIPNFALVLRTLLEQPKAFVDRVVVACLETNFKLPVANLGLDTLLPLAAHSFTSGLRARRAAHDDAATAGRAATFTPLPLSSHLSVTVNDSIHLMNAAAARAFAGDTAGVGAMGRPLLVALPYPTGLSLVTTTSFAPPVEENSFLSDNSSGSNTSKSMSKNSKLGSFEANHNNYDPYRRRPVTILLDASLSRKGQGGKQNWVRGAVRDRLLEAGGTCHGDTCGLCHNHSISAILPNVQTEDSATVVACGWPLAQDSGAAPTTLWEKLVTSSFCLEPAGDTPTRSHMYAAVLSGCVPVLFDGRLPDYPSSVKTGWAWRDDGLRYEDFAVVVNASTVVRHYLTSSAAGPSAEVSSTGGKDLILELSRMPIDDPARFLALRRGVDRAAALLRYAADIDEGETLKLSSHLDSGTSRMDAFQQFESIVRETAALM